MLQEDDLKALRYHQKVDLCCNECNIKFQRSAGVAISSRKNQGCDLCPKCARVATSRRAGKIISERYSGKKLEEIVGVDKALSIRQLLSSQRMGEKNHNFGGRHQKFPIRTGTYEEQYGIEKAIEIKKKLSRSSSGKNNPMFGKPAPKKSGIGISGYYGSIYFRSLLELTYILFLEEHQIHFDTCDGKKAYQFYYTINGAEKTYFPDFYLFETDEFIEVKPSRLVGGMIVQAKANAVMSANKTLRFVTDADLVKILPERLRELIDDGKVVIDDCKLKRLKYT